MVSKCLITVCQTSHTTHDAENVVVGSIDTYLCSLGAFNGGVGQDQLQCGIINAGEIARTRGLMFFWAQSE
jgi:hypothetical protein